VVTEMTDAPTVAPVLTVRDLGVEFHVDGTWHPAATGVTYDVHPGEVLAIVGESGSGKTQSSMAIMGLLPANGRASGSALLGDRELIGMPRQGLQRLRGREVSMIFQEPMTALNPVFTVGDQIVETLRTHFAIGPKDARKRAIDLLRLVEIPSPEQRIDSYPHQLSGGQRQRVMIAQALACDPKLLIADEPTTALDVTVQAEILKLLRDLRTRIDSGIVLITHDMGVVADIADKILVMKDGVVVEQGRTADVFAAPAHDYTRKLLAAVPHLGRSTAEVTERVTKAHGDDTSEAAGNGQQVRGDALRAENLVIEYAGRGRTPAFRAVDGVDLVIGAGEVVGLVGESGSGKTTIGRAVVGLLPVTSGTLEVVGTDLVGATSKSLRPIRDKIGMVFQDPGSSLNPRLPIGESVAEPLVVHGRGDSRARRRKVLDLLDSVNLPRSFINRYPHELSGGQRQRVGIARALALEPKILVADEPTSALDVSVQATVLELFQELQREHGFGCLFISHDLAVVDMLADRVAVMHHGKLVEVGSTAQVVTAPQDPYTQRLIAAVPVPDPVEQSARRARRDALLEAYRQELEEDEALQAEAAAKVDAVAISDVASRQDGPGI
jgi:peptide/nickel transport system ATP-binding protein